MANLLTRILDKAFPSRTMPSAYCAACTKYAMKVEMIRVGWSYVCNEECEDEYWRRTFQA